LVRDKGLTELATAWREIRTAFPAARLFLCGGFEASDPLPGDVLNSLLQDRRIHLSGSLPPEDMPAVYAAIDLCVLPTYREGLPNVALECAAMQVPIVATRIPGCMDAIRDGVTGVLYSPRKPAELVAALTAVLS